MADEQMEQLVPDVEPRSMALPKKKKKKKQLMGPKNIPRTKGLPSRSIKELAPDIPWEEKVVKALHIIRVHRLTEYNHKLYDFVNTRFCHINIAFFDLDKESSPEDAPLLKSVDPKKCWYDDSLNVIAVKVTESDVKFPINVFGTVLVRDTCDYRCVYLFRRTRDNPQCISSSKETLALTGPSRALAVSSDYYFELDLKIRVDGKPDQEFSKGVQVHNTACQTMCPVILSHISRLSTVDLVYTLVPSAIGASVAVNILKGASRSFTAKVAAWTSEDSKNKIILCEGTQLAAAAQGDQEGSEMSLALDRSVVAVPSSGRLVISVSVKKDNVKKDGKKDGDHRPSLYCERSVFAATKGVHVGRKARRSSRRKKEEDGDDGARCFEFILGRDDEECTREQAPYVVQVKVVWSAVVRRQSDTMWERIGDDELLR